MRKNIYILIALISLFATGCNFLDKNPDERADIDTRNKVRLLLVNGYNMPNYGPLGETMSDNIIDNNTPTDESGNTYNNNLMPLNQMYNQFFAWEDVNTSSAQDSPYDIWSSCYQNIAIANQALAAIEALEESGENYDAERAEALLIRAYNHFLLVNIFCQAYKNDVDSRNDIGIHYMTAAETTVKPAYDRSNVAEVYGHIKDDLEEALAKVSDDYYSVPKYHFNVKAAHAFAAKFYLFTRDYDKVIEHANIALGSSAAETAAMMFDAETTKLIGNAELELYAWMSATSPSNFLICTTQSLQERTNWTSYARYTLNREPKDATLTGSGPCWSERFPGTTVWRYNANYGGFTAKLVEVFEYTAKVAGIGYPRILRRELTSGETLLCRAEAEIMKGQYAAAVSDMDIWCKGYCCTTTLTTSRITQFFPLSSEGRRVHYTPTLHTSDMSADWTITDEQKPYLWCALFLRRIETIHDGARWFDIKRYGIEIKHTIGSKGEVKTLVWNDDRRAVQLPQETILAGQEPNPRVITGDNIVINDLSSANADATIYLPNTGSAPEMIPFE